MRIITCHCWFHRGHIVRIEGAESMTTESSARTFMERCDIVGSFSEKPDRLTRRFATPAMRQANETAAGWMRTAGMSVRQAPIGNRTGRYEACSTHALTRAHAINQRPTQ